MRPRAETGRRPAEDDRNDEEEGAPSRIRRGDLDGDDIPGAD